jgi:type IV pilus assembly protein PilZ
MVDEASKKEPFVADNRQHPRKAIHPTVAFQVGDGPRENAHCRDISLGGAFLETTRKIPYETRVKVFVYLPALKAETMVESVVRWSTPDGMGVQFGVMGGRETSALIELLASVGE